jgi:hypothetical protein
VKSVVSSESAEINQSTQNNQQHCRSEPSAIHCSSSHPSLLRSSSAPRSILVHRINATPTHSCHKQCPGQNKQLPGHWGQGPLTSACHKGSPRRFPQSRFEGCPPHTRSNEEASSLPTRDCRATRDSSLHLNNRHLKNYTTVLLLSLPPTTSVLR